MADWRRWMTRGSCWTVTASASSCPGSGSPRPASTPRCRGRDGRLNDMNRELIIVIEQLGREKGIDKEVLFEALESALLSASRKTLGPGDNVRIDIDRKTGEFRVYDRKKVVEAVADPELEISLADAKALNGGGRAGRGARASAGEAAPGVRPHRRPDAPSRSSSSGCATPSARASTRSSPARKVRSSAAWSTASRSATSSSRSARPRRSSPSASRSPGERYNPGDRIRAFVLEVRRTRQGTADHAVAHPSRLSRAALRDGDPRDPGRASWW